MSTTRFPVDSHWFLAPADPIVIELETGQGGTATAIGPAPKPGVRRVIDYVEGANEETTDRQIVAFRNGSSATIIGRLSIADGDPGFMQGPIRGADGVAPTFQVVTDGGITAGKLVMVVHSHFEGVHASQDGAQYVVS